MSKYVSKNNLRRWRRGERDKCREREREEWERDRERDMGHCQTFTVYIHLKYRIAVEDRRKYSLVGSVCTLAQYYNYIVTGWSALNPKYLCEQNSQ